MKKVYVYNTHGCALRNLDTKKIIIYLLKNDYKIVYNPKEADYIIFFTCGVVNTVSESCLNSIKKLQEKYGAELIVAGCLPDIQPEKLSEIFNGNIITTKDLNLNPHKIEKLFPGKKTKFNEISDIDSVDPNIYRKHHFEKLERESSSEKIKNVSSANKLMKKKIFFTNSIAIKLRIHILKNLIGKNSSILHYYGLLSENPPYPLRISWGCTGNCAYCGIKKAVGYHISKPLDQCLNEFKKSLKMGYKDFVLLSDDTGAYGIDIESSLPELLSRITETDGDYKIFLVNLNPCWVVRYIDDLEKIVRNGKIKGMLCSIQSCNNSILKLMNRYSDIEKIKESYKRLKSSYPDLLLTPQLLIGFPTEILEDVEKTLSFIREFNFDSGQFFPFSCIPGTKAAELEPKIPQDVIFKRLKYIRRSLKINGYRSINFRNAVVYYKKND